MQSKEYDLFVAAPRQRELSSFGVKQKTQLILLKYEGAKGSEILIHNIIAAQQP